MTKKVTDIQIHDDGQITLFTDFITNRNKTCFTFHLDDILIALIKNRKGRKANKN